MSQNDKTCLIFLALLLFFGGWQLFFPEKVFHMRHGRWFKYPPEPSDWALWNIRAAGVITLLIALAMIWFCWVDPGAIRRFLPTP